MIKQIAELLNGREYRKEMDTEVERLAKDNNIVIVFGASDDLMEFRGAVDDEIGAYNGATAYINKEFGLVNTASFGECVEECPNCALLKNVIKKSATIKSNEGSPWSYETNIPHEVFKICEDKRELYCKGIVFSMNHLEG